MPRLQRREMLRTTGAALLGLTAFPLEWVAAQDNRKPKILYFNKSSGWTHPVADRQGQPLSHSEKVLMELGAKNGFDVDCCQDAAVFDGSLDRYDLLSFYTNGNPFSEQQQRNLLDAVSAGKPCVGFHAASDSGAGASINPFLAMIGGAFVTHGAQQEATMKVVSPQFPGVEGLAGFQMLEEWYSQDRFAPDMHVILVQETAGMEGDMYKRPPYPATWARMYGKGRVFYTSMGHREEVWTDPLFQKVILGGLSWALGHVNVDIPPNMAQVTPDAEPAKKVG